MLHTFPDHTKRSSFW